MGVKIDIDWLIKSVMALSNIDFEILILNNAVGVLNGTRIDSVQIRKLISELLHLISDTMYTDINENMASLHSSMPDISVVIYNRVRRLNILKLSSMTKGVNGILVSKQDNSLNLLCEIDNDGLSFGINGYYIALVCLGVTIASLSGLEIEIITIYTVKVKGNTKAPYILTHHIVKDNDVYTVNLTEEAKCFTMLASFNDDSFIIQQKK